MLSKILRVSRYSLTSLQGNDRVPHNLQVAARALAVILQERIDQPKELHHSLVLTEIFMALEEVLVCVAIAALHCALAWPLL
jgi:hypothetical protein